MNRTSQVSAYRESEILAATRGGLLVITYDALIAAMTRAQVGITMKNRDVSTSGFGRARVLLAELLATLNQEAGGDLARRLASVYVFLLGELDAASLGGDDGKLDRHIAMVRELRDAYAEISSRAPATVS
ncbi:MAG: flagellar export chaperone FliS [Gemmatimonadaceae bacterium]